MNRVIKFRAWDKQNKIMLCDRLDYICVSNGVIVLVKYGPDGKGMYEPKSVRYLTNPEMDNLIIMQFTGLLDKNGKEIYEGDIIEFDKDEWGGNDNIHTVSWDEVSAEWSWGGGITSDMEYRTVIGTIYENPELLAPSLKD